MTIIFLDADGTLFHPMGYIPQSSMEAIQIAQQNGHKIVLCTGRQKAEVYGDLKKIEYDGMICGAGAYVDAKGTLLSTTVFNAQQREMLTDYFMINRIPCIYETNDAVYGTVQVVDELENRLNALYPAMSMDERKKTGLYRLKNAITVVSEEVILNLEFNKISFLESKIPYKETYLGLCEYFDIVPSTFAPLGSQSGEVANKNISKATGMDILIHHYNINEEDVIALGDGYNDISMFQRANLSIAMGNAPKDLQEMCDMVTDDIDHDGIYNIFKKLNII